jgi:Arf-GAP/GTPase/ANK repeat/PH domain-containing protein 1/3
MNQRSPIQPYLNNSLAVRQEIQRFESVHPSIYAIYDLIDAIPDPLIQQQIREHVVCIEGETLMLYVCLYADCLLITGTPRQKIAIMLSGWGRLTA